MPLRGGESVGQAYVRIYADGSEVPGDIRRSIEEAEPSVREAGRKHGEAYGDEFADSTSKSFKTHFGKGKNEMFRDLDDSLKESVQQLDLANDFLESPAWRKFVAKVEKAFPDEMGNAARLAMRKMEAEFRDSGDFDALNARMQRLGVQVRSAQSEILDSFAADEKKMWQNLLDDAYRENKVFDQKWRDLIHSQEREYDRHIAFLRDLDDAYNEDRARTQADAIRMNKAFDRQVREQEREAVRSSSTALRQFRNNMKEISDEIGKLQRGDSKFRHSQLEQMVAQLKQVAPNLNITQHQLRLFTDHLDVMARDLDRTNPRLAAMRRHTDLLGDSMGRLFGKGSRNNFLNFFGSFVSTLLKFPGKVLLTAAEGVTKFGRSIGEAFSKAGGGGVGILAGAADGFKQIGLLALKAGGAIVAFGAFIGGLGLILGPVVGVLSGLVGILTALSSSLIFAAIGAIAGFAPLLIPIAGIIGGIVLAVNRFKDDAGPLGDLFDHLEDRAKRWVDVFGDRALRNVGEFGSRIDSAFKGLTPLFEAAGKGFNRFLDQMTQGLNSGAFADFIEEFTNFLPHAMKDLGDIFSNTFGGLGGLLRGAIPLSNRLLNWLVKITDQFNKWANSEKGQQEIKDFLEKAGDSAASFGDFLEGAWSWLTKIIGKSKGEGDTLWERIGGKFQKWADYIDAHPDAFKDWMDDADELATSIGHIVDGLTKLIDTLDTKENRKLGNGLVSGLGDALGELGGMIESFRTDFINPIGGGIASFRDDFINPTKDALIAFGDWLGWFFSTLGSGLWYFFGGKWVGDMVEGIGDGLQAAGKWVKKKVSAFFTGLGSLGGGGGGSHGIGANIIDTTAITKDITKAIGQLDKLPGAIKGIAGKVGGAFSGIGSKIKGAFSGIPGAVNGIMNRLPTGVQTVVAQMVNRFSRLASGMGTNASNAVKTVMNWLSDLPTKIGAIPGQIVDKFQGLGQRIITAIGSINIHINWPDPPGWLDKVTATGGVFAGAQARIIGEAGPEAVVPLNRPLNLVDPSVRWLSAIAQGLKMPPMMAEGGVGGGGKTVDASGWTIVTPSEDPWIVATEVVNNLIARVV